MNQLLIPNGGMPLEGDDLLFLQQALRDSFSSMMKALSPSKGHFILQGVNPSYNENTDELTWDAGIVSIDHEILILDAGSVSSDAYDKIDLVFSIGYDPAGLDVFADAVAKETYELRKATIVVKGSPGLVDHPVEELGYLKDLTTNIFKLITLGGAGPSSYLYAYRSNGRITLEGQVQVDQLSTIPGELIVDVPVEIRPMDTLIPVGDTRRWNIPVDVDGREVVLALFDNKLYVRDPANTGVQVPIFIHGVSWQV